MFPFLRANLNIEAAGQVGLMVEAEKHLAGADLETKLGANR